jgi:hypothetical protein
MRKYFSIILFAIISACSPVKKYQDLPAVRAWEKDIAKFEEADSIENYPDDAILFAGSSSIRLWSTLAEDMAPYPVIQRGFGGSHLYDLLVYADRIFNPHQCRAIVLFVANDISGSDQDKSPQEVAKLFKYLLKNIRKSHPDTPVFWIEVTPTSSRWTVWPEIQESTILIGNICEADKNAYSIKTDFAFLNESGRPRDELFVDDKLHLNEKGYAIWSDLIKKELNKVLGE